MTEETRASALRVQRDSAQRQMLKLDTHNRMLRKHQADVRAWLKESIDEFDAATAAGDTAGILKAASKIRQRGGELLKEAEELAR